MSQFPFLNRQALYLRPDSTRVIVRPFKPTTEPRDLIPTDKTRANHIVERVLSLEPADAANQLADVLENFMGRHRNLLEAFEARAEEMEAALADHAVFTQVQRQLVGAYFLNEYSFEASALFNPSIVAHPDQSGVPDGSLRFVLSLRAVGEGHISSLTFRSGSIAADGTVKIDAAARLASSPDIVKFTSGPGGDDIEVTFDSGKEISERVIFPVTESQSNGIEDARFVQFSDGGKKIYYATYTAYSGRAIKSELIETSDFVSFRLSALKGSAARNKGMALFPKKIADLEDDLALFFTGYIRSASDVIKAQTVDNLDAVKQAGHSAYQVLREANFGKMGDQFNKQWDLKLERDSSVSDQIIDWRQRGLDSGARGGKLVGAGGGGFLLFDTWGKQGLRTTMFNLGLKEVRFKFDFEGTKVI